MIKIKRILNRINWVLTTQCGIDIFKFVTFNIKIFGFLFDLFRFLRLSRGTVAVRFQPCLHDKGSNAGDFSHEYFWQDILVAQMVSSMDKSVTICDVGSRIDGYVAHVASSRPITVCDIRPATETIPNVKFIQGNLLNLDLKASFDVVTCLHTIEHMGLGRYGDPIVSDGWKLAMKSLSKLLNPDGQLIVSCPIGIQLVRFNANYILSPKAVIDYAQCMGLKLLSFNILDHSQFRTIPIESDEFTDISTADYNLGLFHFVVV